MLPSIFVPKFGQTMEYILIFCDFILLCLIKHAPLLFVGHSNIALYFITLLSKVTAFIFILTVSINYKTF